MLTKQEFIIIDRLFRQIPDIPFWRAKWYVRDDLGYSIGRTEKVLKAYFKLFVHQLD